MNVLRSISAAFATRAARLLVCFTLALALGAGPLGATGLLELLHSFSCACAHCPQDAGDTPHATCCASAEQADAPELSSAALRSVQRGSDCGCCAVLDTAVPAVSDLCVPRAEQDSSLGLASWIAKCARLSSATVRGTDAGLSWNDPRSWTVDPPGAAAVRRAARTSSLHGSRRLAARGSSSSAFILGCALL